MASGPITSWQIEGEKVETEADFIFLGSKITTDSVCSHEMKRRLLLGRKAMTKLDSLFKSRDTTLLTEVCVVKAMVFPVVICGCESWTIKKAECGSDTTEWLNWTEPWCWRRLLSPLDSKELKPVSPKGNQPWFMEGLMLKLKLQYFGHLMRRVNSLAKTLMLGKIESRRRRGQQRMRWLDSVTDSMDRSLSQLQEIVKDREAWHATVRGITKSRIGTWPSNWTTTMYVFQYYSSHPALSLPHSYQQSVLHILCVLSHFSHVLVFATLWTIAHKAPLSMGCSRREHRSGWLPFPTPGDLHQPESNLPHISCIGRRILYQQHHLGSCPANRIISSTFLDSMYIC